MSAPAVTLVKELQVSTVMWLNDDILYVYGLIGVILSGYL